MKLKHYAMLTAAVAPIALNSCSFKNRKQPVMTGNYLTINDFFSEREEVAYDILDKQLKKVVRKAGMLQAYADSLDQTLMSLIGKESSFLHERDDAVIESPSGALGYTQTKPETAQDMGFSEQDLKSPKKNIRAGATYFVLNLERFVGLQDKEDTASTISFGQARNYAIIAHNLGPSATLRLLEQGSAQGFFHPQAEDFIADLQKYRTIGIEWTKPDGSKDRITPQKIEELIRYFDLIKQSEHLYDVKIENHENRAQAPKDLLVPDQEVSERPVYARVGLKKYLQVMALEGDDAATVAKDYTGELADTSAIIKYNPSLTPGRILLIPKRLLKDPIKEAKFNEVFYLDADHQSIWSYAAAYRDELSPASDVNAFVRLIQRSSKILDPTKVRGETPLYLTWFFEGADRYKAGKEVEAGDLDIINYGIKGYSRTPSKVDFNDKVAAYLQKRGEFSSQLSARSIDMVLIHTTEHGKTSEQNILDGIKAAKTAHYFIGTDGNIDQIVAPGYLTHGAGKSLWAGQFYLDFNAVNIELYANTEGKNDDAITENQYALLSALVHKLMDEYDIPVERVLGHNQVAASWYGNGGFTALRGRKGDPGEHFRWRLLGKEFTDHYTIVDQDILDGTADINADPSADRRRTSGQVEAAKERNTSEYRRLQRR